MNAIGRAIRRLRAGMIAGWHQRRLIALASAVTPA
jgi:hypothetical protein